MDVGSCGMAQVENGQSPPLGGMETTTHAVLDNGATSFVVGNVTLGKNPEQLRQRDFDTETVKVFSCTKTFRFGNDRTGSALGCAIVLMFFGGKYVQILVYILEGATPFLFARPMMEELKLCIDF